MCQGPLGSLAVNARAENGFAKGVSAIALLAPIFDFFELNLSSKNQYADANKAIEHL